MIVGLTGDWTADRLNGALLYLLSYPANQNKNTVMSYKRRRDYFNFKIKIFKNRNEIEDLMMHLLKLLNWKFFLFLTLNYENS